MFLVGNPEKEKLSEEDWFNAIRTVSNLIFAGEEVNTLTSLWAYGYLYYSEYPSVNDATYHIWLRATRLQASEEEIKRLFDLTEQVDDYAIPKQGTKARKMFDATVKMWQSFRDRIDEAHRILTVAAKEMEDVFLGKQKKNGD